MLLIVLFVAITYLAALVAQVALWRFRLPRNHFKTLLLIFGLFLVLGIVAQGLAVDWTHSLLFAQCYGLLSLTYISFYSLIEGQSPSLFLVLAVHRKKAEGLSLVQAAELMSMDDVIGIRLWELDRDNLIFVENDGYRLTPKGIWLARICSCGRRALGMGKGG